MNEVLDIAVEKLNADPRRIYVTGFSLGGIFTSDVAVHLGNRVAACCNWCGGIAAPKSWMNAEQRAIVKEMQPEFHLAERMPPIYLLSCENDTNRPECEVAKEEYEKLGWPMKYECPPGNNLSVA